MTNFDRFGQDARFRRFAGIAASAENLLHIDAEACILNCRRAMEGAVKWMYSVDNALKSPCDTSLYGLMNASAFRDIVNGDVWQRMDLIRRLSNTAAHEDTPATTRQAELCLENLYYFLDFLAYCYADNYTPASFDRALLELTREEALSFVSEKAEPLPPAPAENKAEKRTLTARRAEQTASYVPHTLEKTGFEERKIYIEAMLSDAGWTEGKNLRADVKITGTKQDRGSLTVDYLLYGSGKTVLAVVEAKETCADPEKGRAHALRCAGRIAQKQDFRPVIYCTDGFSVRIDDGFRPERRCAAIASAHDLETLLSLYRTRRSLDNASSDRGIADRPYQRDAVRALCRVLDKEGRQNALLAMASGAGKTRTVISLCRLLRSRGWLENVLYLTENDSLSAQTARAFTKLLPEFACSDLGEAASDASAPIVTASYAAMAAAVDTVRDEQGRKLFTCGHFGLIVCDGAERASEPRYQDLIRYFDGLRVGLVSCAEDAEQPAVRALFSGDAGTPDFVYSFEQAVEDGYLADFLTVASPLKFIPPVTDENRKPSPAPKNGSGKKQSSVSVSPALNRWLSEEDNIRAMLHTVMERGMKLEHGKTLGKTVIFAKDKTHAAKIVRVFAKEYPHKKRFAAVIDSGSPSAKRLLDEFSSPSQLPQIAVSANMLDTGVDIPEILNLVFFEKVSDRSRFLQMVGRGARLCPALLDGEDKQSFCIFDFCGNLEAFSLRSPDDAAALPALRFRLQAVLLAVSCKNSGGGLPGSLRESLCQTLADGVRALDRSSFTVRQHLSAAERFSSSDAFQNLSKEDISVLTEELAPLTVSAEPSAVLRFDILLYGMMLASVSSADDILRALREALFTAVRALDKGALAEAPGEKSAVRRVLSHGRAEDFSLEETEELRFSLRAAAEKLPAEAVPHICGEAEILLRG